MAGPACKSWGQGAELGLLQGSSAGFQCAQERGESWERTAFIEHKVSSTSSTCKNPAGLRNGLQLWLEGMEHSTRAGTQPGMARGKCRHPLLLPCTSSQPCSGLGCSSWGAEHQIPPQTPDHPSPPPSAATWHQKILLFPWMCPPCAPAPSLKPFNSAG